MSAIPPEVEEAVQAVGSGRGGGLEVVMAACVEHGIPEQTGAQCARAMNLLGYGVDVDHNLSLSEIKTIQWANALTVVETYLEANAGHRTGTGLLHALWDAGTHDRDYPKVAHMLITGQALTDAEARAFAVHAWQHSEYPEANLSAREWREIFTATGYLTDADDDEEPEPRPTAPVRVFRGAIAKRKRGMAWSGSRPTADWFARRYDGITLTGQSRPIHSRVWTVEVPPERILARFTRRGEDEYVIDARGLPVEAAPEAISAEGYVECSCGERHWGRFGAAGLLVTDPTATRVLLQRRAETTHHGGTWGLIGGGREDGETPEDAAVREAVEEAGLHPAHLLVIGTVPGADHGDWSYTYVHAIAGEDTPTPAAKGWEVEEHKWFPVDEVPETLHPGLAADWPRLREHVANAAVVLQAHQHGACEPGACDLCALGAS